MIRYRKLLVCKDGFKMSVQTSLGNYCNPRNDTGPYIEVEVGYPSAKEETLMPYADDKDKPTNTVYAYVPIQVVLDIIKAHGGTDVLCDAQGLPAYV